MPIKTQGALPVKEILERENPSAFSKVTETAGAYNVSDTPLMSDTSLTICWLMSSPMATMSTL